MQKYCQMCGQEYDTDETNCPRCGSRLGVMKENGAYFFEATAVDIEVPSMEKAELICSIPEGMVATEDDIQEYFKRRYNADMVTFAPPTPLFAKRVGDKLVPVVLPQEGDELESIPKWRVVSKRGYTNELYADQLRAEGLEVVESGRGVRVADYKEKQFRVGNRLTEVKQGRPAFPF